MAITHVAVGRYPKDFEQGPRVWVVEDERAPKSALKFIAEDNGWDSEWVPEFESLTVYTVSAHTDKLWAPYLKNLKAEREREERRMAEEEDRATYERLKKRFGGA